MKMVCFCEKVHFRFYIPPSSLKNHWEDYATAREDYDEGTELYGLEWRNG